MKKFALVVTGTRGIGKTIAQLLRNEGYDIVVDDFNIENRLVSAKTNSYPYRFDLTDENKFKGSMSAIEGSDASISVLINIDDGSESVLLPGCSSQKNHGEKMLLKQQKHFTLLDQLIEKMAKRGFGRIINIGFTQRCQAGLIGDSGENHPFVHQITKKLAWIKYRQGVTVNTLALRSAEQVTGKIDITSDVLASMMLSERVSTGMAISNIMQHLISVEGGNITDSILTVNCPDMPVELSH